VGSVPRSLHYKFSDGSGQSIAQVMSEHVCNREREDL